VFACLEKLGKGAGGEIQLTDGIEALMQSETVLAYRYQGRRFDCGSKIGYLQASVEIGLQHSETGAAFAEWLKQHT
jgi:UTP--glucose-1-phosphate uridylyltransferase